MSILIKVLTFLGVFLTLGVTLSAQELRPGEDPVYQALQKLQRLETQCYLAKKRAINDLRLWRVVKNDPAEGLKRAGRLESSLRVLETCILEYRSALEKVRRAINRQVIANQREQSGPNAVPGGRDHEMNPKFLPPDRDLP